MENRTKHTYSKTIYDFAKDILVVCPNCAGKAIVKTSDFHLPKTVSAEINVICSSCGYNKVLEKVEKRADEKQKRGKIRIFGAPIDPFFHLPVWLQADFSGETFWAYNLEHLDFLAAHIGAKLRERNGFQPRVRSIGARLPRWMTEAKNRDALLKVITKLKEK